jgi:predicted metal-dependent hydrolase
MDNETSKDIHIDHLIRSNRRTAALEINREGELIVRIPKDTTARQVEDLLREKESWIKTKQAKALQLREENPAHKYVQGEQFLYLGESYPLVIVAAQDQALILKDAFYLDSGTDHQAKNNFESWYRTRARQVISERAAILARNNGYTYSRLRVTSAKTRWGSCGSKRSLNFTWRIIMAPIEIVDYVVVHELVHLEYRNHSRQFWRRVADIQPDYKQHRSWLTENGHRLSLE